MGKTDKAFSALKYLTLITEIGFTMFANIFLGFFIGKHLDQWINSSPIFLLIFTILGVLSGIKSVYSLIMKLGKK